MVDIVGDVVIIKLQGFMTPLEQAMYKHLDGAKKAEDIRNDIYKTFTDGLREQLKQLTGRKIEKVFKHLDMDKDTEYIFVIMEGVIHKAG